MSDLIERQAAIDALKRISFPYWFECGEYLSEDTREIEIISSSKALEAIEVLPSAQPETHDKRTETHACDLIDRQQVLNLFPTHDWKHLYDAVKDLPSAQPEPLTDKEQRIFLSAMGREEEVCKEVDDAWRDCREPYEDSLVHVCNEIKRKVKGALWT